MNSIDVIIKAIMLLYREKQVDYTTGNSDTLIRDTMDAIKTNKKVAFMGKSDETINDLKQFVIEQLTSDELDPDIMIQTLTILLDYNTEMITLFEKNIKLELPLNRRLSTITLYRNHLRAYINKMNGGEVLAKLNYQLAMTGSLVEQEKLFTEASNEIKRIQDSIGTGDNKDDSIIDMIDLNNDDQLESVVKSAKDNLSEEGMLKTGWHGFNRMTQGGFRRGEFTILAALEHRYKSQLVQSLFMQFAMHNQPHLFDETKKPLLVYVSFEDNLPNIVNFMYKYLYFNIHNRLPDMVNTAVEDITSLIKTELTKNGFNVEFFRANPIKWSYTRISEYINKKEAEGYEIVAIIWDYLEKISRNDIVDDGITGSKMRTLIRWVRTIASEKRITMITPHQLSVDAIQLLRSGEPDKTFVKSLIGKGYTSESKQINQEPDMMFFIHIANIEGKPFLTVHRDRHRGVDILEQEKKFFMLPFPHLAPIPYDLGREEITIYPDKEKENDDGLGF